MNRKNFTRNALFTSIISLLLCVSMLVGTTFAWFTDEVESGMNTIAAGNLDVELLANGTQVNSNTKLFDDVEKWEPGVVVYENIQVANVGTLALKYQLTLNFGNENNLNGHKLSEVVKVAMIDKVSANATRAEVLAAAKAAIPQTTGQGLLSNFIVNGSLQAGESSDEKTIVIFWEPNDNATDNLYNANNGQITSDGEPLHIEFGLNLQATQLMHESDSFGNDYDQFSSILPKASVINTGRKDVIARDVDNWNEAGEMITLDTSYQFLPNETLAEAQSSQYRYWHADWVISVDRAIPAGSAALAGYYKLFGDFLGTTDWIALTGAEDVPANTEIRLLYDGMGGASINYEEICEYANDGIGFLCGAADLTGENAGTTLTVELRLYETTGDPATEDGPKNEETGVYKTIGKFQYTFGTNSPAGFKAALSAGVPNIILENDIELNDEPLVVTGNTVIDMNGHSIIGVSTSKTTSNLITVANGAQLTLTGNGLINFAATYPDTEWGGEGQPAFPGYANNTISCQGKLIIDGVTIKNSTAPGGASYAIDCYPGADLVVNSGTIDGMGKCAIRMFANSNTVETNVTINGGLITGKRGIWIQLPSSSLTNERLANLTVTGGKIIATSSDDCAIYSYSYGDSFAKTNINISGGEFTGVVAFGGGEKTTKENVNITGGTFKNGVGRYLENDVWEAFTV